MKYKHIQSVIHNFGASFLSYVNYVDNDFVIYDLRNIHNKGHHIEIDWVASEFMASQLISPRINTSVGLWTDRLEDHLSSQRVNIKQLSAIRLVWPPNKVAYMYAKDHRCKEYKIELYNC